MRGRRFPRLDESKIVRSRPVDAVVLGGKYDPALDLWAQLAAVGIPAPELEWHFMWCCSCQRTDHVVNDAGVALCRRCHELGPGVTGIRFRHEYSHERDWRFDFAWPPQHLALEVDGGTWNGGRHVRGAGYEEDCRKLNEALVRGWRVLRFTTDMVKSGEALELVERALGVR